MRGAGVMAALSLVTLGGSVLAADPSARPASGGSVVGSDVPALRTEFSQTHRLPGGMLETTFSGAPLNHRDAGGAWQPIDNRLERQADGSWEVRSNDVDVEIPATANGEVRFSEDGDAVSFSLVGSGDAPADVSGEVAEYADVKTDTELSYEVDGRVLKETLTLTSSEAPDAYRFEIDAGALRPQLRASGDVAFVDSSGQPQLGFQAPWMRDADGEISRGASYELQRVDGRDHVILRLDADWLGNAERRFPVVVDPSVYSGWEHVCEIRSGTRSNTTACDGALAESWVGRDGSGIVYRNLYELQDFRSAIPDESQIIDSWFAVYLNGQNPVAASDLDLHHLTRGFTPGVTWNRSDGRVLWGRPGGDYDPQRLDRSSTGDADPRSGWMAFDITRLARDLLTGAETSPNLLVKAADESRAHVDSFDDAEVKVRWRPHTGLLPQHTYESFELADGSRLSQNMPNGNLVLSANDLGWEPADGRAATVRHFNSLHMRLGYDGVFNTGSEGSAGTIRLEHQGLDDSYVYTGPSGHIGVFERRDDGTFAAPPGLDATLTELSAGGFTIQYGDTGELWTFDADGDLRQTRQADGYTIDIHFGSHGLASLSDSTGRTAVAGYDLNGDLRTITENGGAVHRYDYDGDDNLAAYISPDGDRTRYSYDSSARLTRIDLPDRTALKISYHGATAYPALITPVDAAGNDQPATGYDGESGWVWSERPASPRTVYFFDPYTLVVDLIQTGSAAVIVPSGPITALDGGYTRGDHALTVDVTAAQAPDGIQLTELEVDDIEVDAVGVAPCDEETCPNRVRETLSYDPTFDPEGLYDYRVNTIDGDDERTNGPLWRLAIDRTGPNIAGMSAGASVPEGETTATVGWSGAVDPPLPDATPGSGLGEHAYRFRRSGGAWSAWQPTAGHSFALPGSHEGEVVDLEVKPFDRIGNAGSVFATQVTVVLVPSDEVGPELVLSGTLADRDGAYAGSGLLGLEVLAEDIDGTGVRSIAIERGGTVLDRVDSNCTGGCPETQRAHLDLDTTLVPEGEVTVAVTAVDAAGNSSVAGEGVSIIVDRTAPSFPSRIALRDFDASAGQVTLDWMEGDDSELPGGLNGAGLRASEYRWRLTGGTFSAWNRTGGSDADLRGVRLNDEVEVELRSLDMVGNMSGPATSTLTVRRDPEPPAEPFGVAPDPGACVPRLDYMRARNDEPNYREFVKVETFVEAQLLVNCVIRDSTTHVVMTAQPAFRVNENDVRPVGAERVITIRPRSFHDVKVRGISAICMPNMAGNRDYIVVGQLRYVRDEALPYTREFWTDIDDTVRVGCPVESERRRREVAGFRAMLKLNARDPEDTRRRSSSAQLRRTLGHEPWAPDGVKRPWAAHHVVPGSEARAADIQALMFRCKVHPNHARNGVFLRGDGLRRTLRSTGRPNPAYLKLQAHDALVRAAYADRAYHPDTRRDEYFDDLRGRMSNVLRTQTERCPNGQNDLHEVLQNAVGALAGGTFDVGTPRN